MITASALEKNEVLACLEGDFLDDALAQGFGNLHFKVDSATGMKAIIAIHSTTRGPALGGCRFIEYPSTTTAINDVMRLAKGMSYKAASANLPLGGGKAVIIKPCGTYDRDAYFHAFGKFINELGGQYITALDSGTQLPDMDIIAQHTPYVASLSTFNGDPSPYTARGVLSGIQAAVEFKLGKSSLKGIKVAIQGLGHVGYALASLLHDLGAELIVADINELAVEHAITEFGARAVTTDLIHKTHCDVYAPCALGGALNDFTINQLQTSIVAGAANNQLARANHGQLLHDKGILYAPDYVINAGGLIFAASKYLGTAGESMMEQIANIHLSMVEIFKRSVLENRSTTEIADCIAQEKLS